MMDWQNFPDRFDFNNQPLINQHIQPVAGFDVSATVLHWQYHLPPDRVSSLYKFQRKAVLVDAFKQTWSKCCVDMKACIDNVLCQSFICICQRCSICFCVAHVGK